MRQAFLHRHTRGLMRAASGTGAALLLVSACGGSFSSGDASAGANAGGGSGQTQGHGGTASSAAGAGASAGNGSATSGGGTSSSGGASGGASSGAAGSPVGGAPSTGGGNAGGAGGGAVSQCPCAAPTPTCEAGKCVDRGPTMVKVEGFYIDSTEVTNGQYAVFEKAKGTDTSGQAAECSWNTSYDPAFDPASPMPAAKHPVTNVDFCDAAAYCAWADKQLCGKIGGGDLQFAELADATKSQWFLACSGTKGQLYPYGAAYQSGFCNDTSGAQALVDAASEPKCQGFYPGLFDMLGNAREWVNTCDKKSGQADGCETIGGSYLATTSCGQSGLATRSLQAPELGFRCCSK